MISSKRNVREPGLNATSGRRRHRKPAHLLMEIKMRTLKRLIESSYSCGLECVAFMRGRAWCGYVCVYVKDKDGVLLELRLSIGESLSGTVTSTSCWCSSFDTTLNQLLSTDEAPRYMLYRTPLCCSPAGSSYADVHFSPNADAQCIQSHSLHAMNLRDQ